MILHRYVAVLAFASICVNALAQPPEAEVAEEPVATVSASLTIRPESTVGEVLNRIAATEGIPIVGTLQPHRLDQKVPPGTYELDRLIQILAEENGCTLQRTTVGYLVNAKESPPELDHLGAQVVRALSEWRLFADFLASMTPDQTGQLTKGIVPFIPLIGEDAQQQASFARHVIKLVSPMDEAAGIPLVGDVPADAV